MKFSSVGATLIEILVAIGVLGVVFSGLGYASFRDFARRQTLENSYRNLLSDLRFAQKNSSSGTKPSGCTGVLDGYRFSEANCSGGNCSRYVISAKCNGGTVIAPTKTVDLPANIRLGVAASFDFKALGQGTSLPIGAQVNLILTDTSGTLTRTLTVSDSGEIK